MNTVDTAASVVADNVADAAAAVTAGGDSSGVVSKRKGRPLDPESNMGRARAIVSSYTDPKASSKVIKERLVAELTGRDGKAISQATANTYFYSILNPKK